MEASPLIKAHDHAREASIATHALDTTVAVTEHALAAGEFATAAQTTASTEALRTLKLLEQHHERLSQLLRYSIEHPTQQQKRQQQQQQVEGEAANEKDGTTSTTTGGAGGTTTTTLSGVVSRGEFSNASRSRTVGQTADYTEAGRTGSAAAASMSAAAAAHQAGAAAMASALGSSPSSPSQRRYPATRELSSSIANNLASARGIRGRHRGQPAAPSMSNEQAPGNLDGQLGGDLDGSRTHMQSVLQQLPDGKPSWVPPAAVAAVPSRLGAEKSESPGLRSRDQDQDQDQMAAAATAVSTADDGFSRFYSRFGSIINRLSAPLAFAGLPLIAEEPGSTTGGGAGGGDATEQAPVEQQTAPHPIPQQRRRSRPPSVMLPTTPPSFGAEPELSKIYSKAALRAIGRDGHSAMDSFYVVPRTGHTASYANILSFDQKERRRMAASVHGEEELLDHGDEDAFVDAKESQINGRRTVRGGGHEAQHVVEELYIENQSLKDMLDKLSKRLHAFEASAQHSHLALQESMRLMRPGSPLSASVMGGGGPSDEIPKRMAELETELARALRQLEASEKERAHQEKTLQRYRDKWEKLKADAKARKGAQSQGQGASASDGTSTPR